MKTLDFLHRADATYLVFCRDTDNDLYVLHHDKWETRVLIAQVPDFSKNKYPADLIQKFLAVHGMSLPALRRLSARIEALPTSFWEEPLEDCEEGQTAVTPVRDSVFYRRLGLTVEAFEFNPLPPVQIMGTQCHYKSNALTVYGNGLISSAALAAYLGRVLKGTQYADATITALTAKGTAYIEFKRPVKVRAIADFLQGKK